MKTDLSFVFFPRERHSMFAHIEASVLAKSCRLLLITAPLSIIGCHARIDYQQEEETECLKPR